MGEARDEPTEKRNPRVSTRIHRKIKIIACERTAKVEEEEQGERRCFQAASVNVKTKEIQSKLVRFPVSVLCSPYTQMQNVYAHVLLAKVSGRSRERTAISILDSY